MKNRYSPDKQSQAVHFLGLDSKPVSKLEKDALKAKAFNQEASFQAVEDGKLRVAYENGIQMEVYRP
jgi:hypothetical protein